MVNVGLLLEACHHILYSGITSLLAYHMYIPFSIINTLKVFYIRHSKHCRPSQGTVELSWVRVHRGEGLSPALLPSDALREGCWKVEFRQDSVGKLHWAPCNRFEHYGPR